MKCYLVQAQCFYDANAPMQWGNPRVVAVQPGKYSKQGCGSLSLSSSRDEREDESTLSRSP